MLYEFALEPAVIRGWDRLQFFLSNFGVEHGRLIARYPKRWEKLVIEGLSSCKDLEKKRIIEALARGRNRLFPRHHEWNEQLPWLDNAVLEHGKRPFHAIVATRNVLGLDDILPEDIDITAPPRLWQVPRSTAVQRKAAVMADAARKLLRLSRTVLFIDRNFTPKDKGFRVALEAFLGALLDQHKKWLASRIEYHLGDSIAGDDFPDLCKAWLWDVIPCGMQVRFCRWNRTQLHNRYILTDVGGLEFGQGLDQAGETEQQEDQLTLLGQREAAMLLEGFLGASPKYTRDATEATLIGKKVV
jgi:hypothetical protein